MTAPTKVAATARPSGLTRLPATRRPAQILSGGNGNKTSGIGVVTGRGIKPHVNSK